MVGGGGQVDAVVGVTSSGRNVSLSDVCFNPMGTACAIQSVLQV